MEDAPEAWRICYTRMQSEPDPKQKLVMCQKVRRLMQERLIQLSSEDPSLLGSNEQSEIEDALRNLWTIEQDLRKPLS
jgi:hypothetical protein